MVLDPYQRYGNVDGGAIATDQSQYIKTLLQNASFIIN